MTVDARQQPVFSDSDPVALATYLNQVGRVSEYGPVRVGTQAERLAVDAYEGCRWVQTDQGGGEWVHDGSSWLPAAQIASAVGTWTFPSTTNAGSYSLMTLGGYDRADPHGLVQSWDDNGWIKVAKPGTYLIVANAATFYGTSPITMHLGFLVDGAELSERFLRGRSEVTNSGPSGACAVGASTIVTLAAGGRVQPRMNVSRNTQRPDGKEFYVHLHRLAPV